MSAGNSRSFSFGSAEVFSEFPTFKTNLIGGSSAFSGTYKVILFIGLLWGQNLHLILLIVAFEI